jgi:hypothetical protein
MEKIYGIQESMNPIAEFTLRRPIALDKNYWNTTFVTPDQFENGSHMLEAWNGAYEHGSSDQCPDVNEADIAIWTMPEKAWDWLPALQASGCRIAHNVHVERGGKAFKLVYAAAVCDIFDVANSLNVEWNGNTISWVRGTRLYAWDAPLPMMFQVLYLNRDGAEYKGGRFGLSGRCYVSSAFKEEYERRDLTGLEFGEMPRTQPPEGFVPMIFGVG